MRALERSLGSLSPRGVPLIGTGDWNDGMNRVGSEGRGESFWLGWFLGAATYRIRVRNPDDRCRGLAGITVDGQPVEGPVIATPDDGALHDVEVVMGADREVPGARPAGTPG